VAAGVLALGLANFAPVILGRCQVYEVPISCGYALTMLALAAVWKALHKGRWQWEWLAAASLAYGLALGARPSLFFGAVILLVPLAQEWREKRRMGSLLAAAAVPIALVGLGLMLYNALRFGDPLEFGQKYQLPLPPQRQFSPQYIGFNLIVGFLAPARWGGQLPIVQDARGLADIALPALPPRYHNVDYPFGILTNIPLVWLALAGPLAWRRRGDGADRPVLRWFLGAVAFLFAMIALPLLTHDSMSVRYEMEYTAPLVLLAAVGALALERALAGRTLWRRVARCGWGLLLISSIVFNLFAAFQLRADSHADIAFNLLQAGRPDQAVVEYEKALRLKPNYAEAHNNLGDALTRLGRANEAVAHFQRALQLKPDYSEACYNYGTTLLQMGKLDEAIAQLEKSAQIKPDFAEARNNLGNALLLKGSLNEAVSQLREALRINPNHTTAHFNLGNALAQMGRLDEAITHFQQALQFNPDYAEAHCNLGTTLLQKGRVDEAIPHFRKALEIRPAYADACANLGVALARKGQTKEAIASWQRSLEINPDQVNVELNLAWLLATSPEASLRNGARAVALATQADQSGGGGNPMILRALAAAYAEARSYELAASTARRALDLAVTQKNDALAASLREDVKLYETGAPLRETPP
jgi:tetratricopeptide (TPR) repeat protein